MPNQLLEARNSAADPIGCDSDRIGTCRRASLFAAIPTMLEGGRDGLPKAGTTNHR